jgi:cobalt-zinc-cadmium efflux system membrane fusion protein
MAMIRILFLGLLASVTLPALADSSASLGLTSVDLDRLGVTLQAPQIVTEIEIASGPAEVVIPPAQEAIVTSTIRGVLSRVLVAEGDFVAAGQALAEITSAELLELQREYIEAALATDLARAQLGRDRELHADGIIAERRVLESDAAERAATATLDQLHQQLSLAGMSQSDLARLLDTRELSATLTLKAPFAAFVVDQRSALGTRIDALDPVYRLADLSSLWLELHVPQEASDRIRPGMRVLASVAGRIIDGEISHIGRVADAASQTVLVRARVENEDLILRVGQFLAARVLALDVEGGNALAVPTAAIVRVDGEACVFGGRDGEIAALPVDILAEDGINTYVNGNLGSGVEVAVAGIAALKSVWVSAQVGGE